MPTKESRKQLQGPVSLDVFVNQMANSLGTAAILSSGNLNDLKYYMKDLFSEPVRTKSIDGYEDFKSSLISLGAKAVGLSGGGPTQYAICDSRNTANEVLIEAERFYGKLIVKHVGSVNLEGVIYE
jgi:homoserine kinase